MNYGLADFDNDTWGLVSSTARESAQTAIQWLAGNLSRSGGAVRTVTWWQNPDGQDRAYCLFDEIHIGKHASVEDAVHEFGHVIENTVPGVADAARKFLESRVGDEPLKPMNEITGGSGYSSNEMGRSGDFAKVFGDNAGYVGKHYAGGATEIVSMGLEQMYRDPAKFAAKDPEYFKFMLGIIGPRSSSRPSTSPEESTDDQPQPPME